MCLLETNFDHFQLMKQHMQGLGRQKLDKLQIMNKFKFAPYLCLFFTLCLSERKGEGERGHCRRSPEHQYVVTVMSQGRLSVSCGQAAWRAGRQRDRSKGPAGVDVDVDVALLFAWRRVFVCICVCFYTEEP